MDLIPYIDIPELLIGRLLISLIGPLLLAYLMNTSLLYVLLIVIIFTGITSGFHVSSRVKTSIVILGLFVSYSTAIWGPKKTPLTQETILIPKTWSTRGE